MNVPNNPRNENLTIPTDLMSAGRLRFSQINLQHCIAATALLCRYRADRRTSPPPSPSPSPHISLIQEPYVYEGQVKGLREGSSTMIHGADALGPRACILASKDCKALGLNRFCTRDLAAAKIELRASGAKRDLVVASAYLPYDSRELPPTQELSKLIEFCHAEGLDLIVGCDANSHHTVWGSSDVNVRGSALLEYLTTTDLEILNKGSRPTFVTSRRQEVIDISLGTRGVASNIVGWRVTDEETLSDHRLITFSLDTKMEIEEAAPRRNPRATDWTAYRAGLSKHLGPPESGLRTQGLIERAVEGIQTAILTAYEAACPIRQQKSGKKVGWWSKDLSELRRTTRKLLNKATKHQLPEDWEAYRCAQKSFKKLVRRSKRESWRNFCEETEALPLVARLRKIFATGPARKPDSITLEDGSSIESHEGILKHLLDVHFPGSTTRDEDHPLLDESKSWSRGKNRDMARKIVTTEKVRWAIASFHRFKSPGTDGIFPALLQEGGEEIVGHLTPIFRACLDLGYIPRAWREARVVFIPKPGKNCYDTAKSFRPISLTSFLLKTMERIVDRHIRETALIARPVQRSQHAYQTGRSVETALHTLVRELESALRAKESVLTVFLDIEGAFDNTPFEAMSEAMDRFGVDVATNTWVSRMLRSRNVNASLCGTETSARVRRGCPQGGVLSPLLWTMVVDQLLGRLEETGVTVQGYADDIAIAVRGKNPGILTRKMQKALDLVQDWCTTQSLRVNPSKTEMVIFTRKRQLDISAPSIYGVELVASKEVRYLGITLDEKLTWKSHITKQAQKAISTFWACRRMFGNKWGLKPKMVKWIYTAIMVPQIVYGSVVWWPALKRATNMRDLDKPYRLALLGITGAMRTTPTLAIGGLLCMEPPHIAAMAHARSAAQRLLTNGYWRRHSQGHASMLSVTGVPEGTMGRGVDACPKEYHFQVPYRVLYPSRQEWLGKGTKLLQPGGLVLFTDGAKSRRGAGVGVWGEGPRIAKSWSLGTETTILQAEVLSVYSGAEELAKRGCRGHHIYICNDSQKALEKLHSVVVDTALVRDCRAALTRLSKDNRVTLLWVPAHAGIPGNEKADELARAGITNPSHGAKAIGIARTAMKELSREWSMDRLREAWIAAPGMRHTRALARGPSKKLGDLMISLDRPMLRLAVGLITGHWHTRRHLGTLGLCEGTICPRCGLDDETPHHLITTCPGLVETRNNTLGSAYLEGIQLNGAGLRGLLNFAKEAGLDQR